MTRPTTHWQRGLQHFNGVLFLPNSVDGTGGGLGSAWSTDTAAAGITITHTGGSTAFDTQLKRTIYTQVVTATNQELGPRLKNAGDYQFWLGNNTVSDKDYLGGFYFSTIFRIGAWQADTGRLFAGLTASTNPVCISDTEPANTIGLWHETTDGQDELYIVAVTNAGSPGGVTKVQITDNSGAVSPAVNAPGILAAGVTLMFEMWAFPSAVGTVNTNIRLAKFNATTKAVTEVVWHAVGGGPLNTAMMAPQVQMSNGTADTTAGHYAIEVANVYCTSPSGELL
jgi:hypothetical protein